MHFSYVNLTIKQDGFLTFENYHRMQYQLVLEVEF